MFDYPASIGISFAIIFTTILVFVASKFDPTMGVLTVSLLVVIAFIGVAVFCLFFTVPSDEITSAVIGGLTAAFGAIVAYWLGKK